MPFDCLEVSLQLTRSVRTVLARLGTKDSSLTDQLRRATASVPLNLSEGRRRVGKDRLHLWRVAAGSAQEVRATLQVAEAFGYVDGEDVGEALGLVDRVLAMTWRMTR